MVRETKEIYLLSRKCRGTGRRTGGRGFEKGTEGEKKQRKKPELENGLTRANLGKTLLEAA